MKHFKQFFSFVLTLVLVVTGLNIPLTMPNVQAEGVVTSAGTTSVSTTPSDLLDFGEWTYWVENGVAYIAGYGNTSESSLKIPGSLGGYPVAGIGHKAFSNMTKLKSIQIHTNVTRIADDAFEGVNGISIKAYHGAYALAYASSHGISKSNLTAGIQFQNGVIDLTGLSGKAYSNLSEGSVTFKQNEATFLKLNQILYFPKQAGFSDGLVKRVVGIDTSGDSVLLTLAQPLWGEVVDSLSGSTELLFDWSHAVWSEGFSCDDVGASGVTYEKSSKKISVTVSGKVKGVDFKITGSIKTSFGEPVFDYEFKGVVAKYLSVDFPVYTTPSVSVSIAAKDKERYRTLAEKLAEEPEPTKKLKVVELPILSAGGLLASVSGYLSLYFKYSISAEGKISCTIETVYSFRYSSGKITRDKRTTVRDNTTEFSGKAKVGPELSFYIVVRVGTLKIKCVEFSVGIFVEAKASYKKTTVWGKNKQTAVRCFNISVECYAEAEIKMGALSVDGLLGNYGEDLISKTIPVFKIPIGSTLSLHYEPDTNLSSVSGLGLPERCSLKDRRVVFDNYNGIYDSATVDVNSHIKEPKKPTRSGYTFAGWYVDTKKSNLGGTDYQFNFSQDVMPYIDDLGTFYLYAKWTKNGTSGSSTTHPSTPTPTPTTTQGTATPTPVVTPTPTPEPVPVSNISLNTHSIEKYNDNPSEVITLTATVYPENADDKTVTWESSDPSVVSYKEDGVFEIGEKGTATITCRSVNNPEVFDTCTITVKQHVQQIYVEGDKDSLLPGETAQMIADCFPTTANNKEVTWTSSNTNIATVSQTGLVTAVGYGDVTISGTTKDGSNLTASFTIRVEHELALDVNIVNNTAFVQSEEELLIAYITPTTGSMRRMAQGNYDLQWSVTRKNGTATAEIDEIETTYSENGVNYESSFVSLVGTSFPASGTSTFTINCNAGPYSAEVDVTVNADGTVYASDVKLNPSTFYLSIGEKAAISNQPVSVDNKPVPSGMDTNIDGDDYFLKHSTKESTASGVNVSFDESGVYSAIVKYQKANISYEVPVTFYVQDADGIVHLRVESIELNDFYIQMVQGDIYQLSATVLPNDAYEKSVAWSSSDSTIATVSSTGLVTAKKPGSVAIYCEANDGSGVYAMCAITVEAYLQLDEDIVEYTVYKSGEDHTDLGIINLTYSSQRRLIEDNLNVTWKLTRNSGSSTEIALEEFRSTAEESVSVTGNIIQLIRINGTGDDEYTLTCTAGSYSDQCTIRIHVLDTPLPTSVNLSTTTYEGTIDEVIDIDLNPICYPLGTALPEETTVLIDGNRVFLDALSSESSFDEPDKLIFEKAGNYQANVVFSGNNYSYICPISITVKDENGLVPKNISDIIVTPKRLTMLCGETANLNAIVQPADATYSQLNWSSSDTSVVSVSSSGKVTAIEPGVTTVLVTAPETDIVGGCLIVVESGLTLETNELERTVFVDGITRMELDTVMLTESSSLRQTSAPEWKLTRKSGNNLTLRTEPYQTTNTSGDVLYGCKIILYSVSRVGDTMYELSCTNETETATVSITVHAINRNTSLPAGIEMMDSTFTSNINELITINPIYVCYPDDTNVPSGMKISIKGDRQFVAALNVQDFFVSQSLSTLSFSKAGTYHATYVMEYSNVKYVIPLLFRIKDSQGNVPVQASEIKLNYRNLNMVCNDVVQLEAVFSPADTTNQNVSWQSSDTSIATVTSSGKVTAVGNGMATITCTPADTEVLPVTCAITVEDFLTIIPGNTSLVLYKQGDQVNSVAEVMLSVGTIERLVKADITPEWSIDLTQVSHSELIMDVSSDESSVLVTTLSLLSSGTDTYTITCTAGSHTWQQDYQLIIRDVSGIVPTSISMNNPVVNANVDQLVTIDFTPVLTPSNAQIPSNMRSSYVGLGDFYDARDDASYVAEGDTVTVKFTKTGQYILTRRYRLGNMQYVVPCVIQVGGASSGYNLLSATETEYTVYSGGRSGCVSSVFLNDHMIETLWGNNIHWSIQRISGNSLNVALKHNGSNSDVFVVDAEKNGTDIWRVTAEFGGLSDSIDIALTSAQPRGPVPESISLSDDTITGVIGTWINVPLSAACLPAGSMLPDHGDEFWSVEMDAHGTDRSEHYIENGQAWFSFIESGYYTAEFKYQSGNICYLVPVYFEIRDEEDVVSKPNLQLFLVNVSQVVYPEGEINIPIGQVVIAETMSTSNIGSSLSYMNNHNASWNIQINSGSAASLTIERFNANTYDIVLKRIKSAGDISYSISCQVNGDTYAISGSLHVAADSEERPDPTLLHTSYQIIQGEQLVIDRKLYSKKDGSVLQSSSSWDPSSFLAATGYEIREDDNTWLVTFYKAGTYSTIVNGYASNLKIQVPLTIRVIPFGGTIELTVMKLPSALTYIDNEAFMGVKTNVFDLRGTRITTIGSKAFMNCLDLLEVYLPATVETIADDAFYGCLNVTFYCPSGSNAEAYAIAHGIKVAH